MNTPPSWRREWKAPSVRQRSVTMSQPTLEQPKRNKVFAGNTLLAVLLVISVYALCIRGAFALLDVSIEYYKCVLLAVLYNVVRALDNAITNAGDKAR
jgi:hypothetical protein